MPQYFSKPFLSPAEEINNGCQGLRPYYVISYNKQGSFKMITDDYNNGPRVVRKDYVLWKIQNMQESASMPSSSGQSQFSIMSLVTLKLKLKN